MSLENTNARYLERLPEPADFVTMDASFISLKLLLPVAKGWLNLQSRNSNVAGSIELEIGDRTLGIVALIKPQFEAGRGKLSKRGVVRDPEVHRAVLEDIVQFAAESGLGLSGLMASPVVGPKGNVEFLAWLRFGQYTLTAPAAIDMALREASSG